MAAPREQIELTIEATTYTLSAGDSFFFKNHLTNSFRNPGSVPLASSG